LHIFFRSTILKLLNIGNVVNIFIGMSFARLIRAVNKQLRKELYVAMDAHFFNRRANRGCVGFHWHRWGGNGNCAGSVLCFSSFIFSIADSPCYCWLTRQTVELNLKGNFVPSGGGKKERFRAGAEKDYMKPFFNSDNSTSNQLNS
jgi:hypothetical protein